MLSFSKSLSGDKTLSPDKTQKETSLIHLEKMHYVTYFPVFWPVLFDSTNAQFWLVDNYVNRVRKVVKQNRV
jgi:hypothetical protein